MSLQYVVKLSDKMSLNEQSKVNLPQEYLEKLIEEWVLDDNGKNILYKSNGEERYPDFKLYKMITRKCSKNTPESQLEKDIFKKFISSKKKIGKKAKIMNIDKIPKMF